MQQRKAFLVTYGQTWLLLSNKIKEWRKKERKSFFSSQFLLLLEQGEAASAMCMCVRTCVCLSRKRRWRPQVFPSPFFHSFFPLLCFTSLWSYYSTLHSIYTLYCIRKSKKEKRRKRKRNSSSKRRRRRSVKRMAKREGERKNLLTRSPSTLCASFPLSFFFLPIGFPQEKRGRGEKLGGYQSGRRRVLWRTSNAFGENEVGKREQRERERRPELFAVCLSYSRGERSQPCFCRNFGKTSWEKRRKRRGRVEKRSTNCGVFQQSSFSVDLFKGKGGGKQSNSEKRRWGRPIIIHSQESAREVYFEAVTRGELCASLR